MAFLTKVRSKAMQNDVILITQFNRKNVIVKDKNGNVLGRIPELTYLSSGIWASPAQTLVNRVNVMRSGINQQNLNMSRQV